MNEKHFKKEYEKKIQLFKKLNEHYYNVSKLNAKI